ncbi:uncharacterized protein [Lolium perenne]|uniref:uncharacterized protein n=1 Tax=Lolium perenne TaxID=4522 RepID=UPI003A99C110
MVDAASILHEHHGKQMSVYRGSKKGRQGNVSRNRVSGHARLYKDYFHLTDLVYKEQMFRRRYRMSRDLFMVILWDVRDNDAYFHCKPDATGKLGFTSYQKCSTTIRMHFYGMFGDIFDEYLQMCESTCHESMYRFCRAVNGVWRTVLESPNC